MENKRNIPVVVAYVHKETIDNFAKFFPNCVAAGIHLDDRVTFTDRGKQLGAQELLAKWGVMLHLKFCSLQLRFNTMDKFKSLDLCESMVNEDDFRLQSSHPTAGFDSSSACIEARYPDPITIVVGDKTVHEFVWSYLRGIHPTSWTTVDNMQFSGYKQKNGCDLHGMELKPLPLFGARTTSGVEGDKNGLQWGGVRTHRVYNSLRAFCLRAVAVCTKRLALVTKWKTDGFELTPHAWKLMKQEQGSVGKLTVVPATTPNFLVFDAFDVSGRAGCTTLYEVNMASSHCSRCVALEQLRIPAIRPPPYYRQAGRSLQRSAQNADRVRGCKRKHNKGEGNAKRMWSSHQLCRRASKNMTRELLQSQNFLLQR
ncbi:hypothetical protein GQ600_27793 [Phytophthora cactorum]|nr:hypothetical protein GQ600_27793 [Phytophthora cactorum]